MDSRFYNFHSIIHIYRRILDRHLPTQDYPLNFQGVILEDTYWEPIWCVRNQIYQVDLSFDSEVALFVAFVGYWDSPAFGLDLDVAGRFD